MRISGISPEGKLIGAELLNMVLIVSQLSAGLQQIAFEGGERLPYQIFGGMSFQTISRRRSIR